jgi:hypothetical protein
MTLPRAAAHSSVAIYWDFENLHAGLIEDRFGEGTYAKPDNRFKVQEPLVDIQAIVELGASFGPVAINRAYCNWQYFGRYRDALLQCAVELIQLFPPGASAKNGADIKLCLDAVEDVARFPHIETLIIVAGDSDFMPVAQKIKAAGRTLVGVGSRRATNRHWAKSCHEFRYYEHLLEGRVAAEVSETTGQGVGLDAAAAIVRRAVRLLAENRGEPWVSQAALWPMIKRLDSSFDPREHGHTGFAEMLTALDRVIEARMGEFEQEVRLRTA